MPFHVIAGLPRSGSTLLCNILSQRPELHVSSTSALPGLLAGISQLLTNSPEVTSDLIADRNDNTRDRSLRVLRSSVEAWYADEFDDKVVIDKSRGWGPNSVLLQRVFPEAVMLVLVRDPREVFASIERQHRKSGEYGPHELVLDKASTMMSPQGMIGGPIAWCEDLIRRRMNRILFISYDGLISSPESTMSLVDRALDLPPHEYDFVNVENVSTDADALYRFKYPHEGSGPVETRPGGWDDVIDDTLAKQIAARWPFFMSTFGFA